MLAALIRPIFAAQSREEARELLRAPSRRSSAWPKVAAMLEAAEEDVLALLATPSAPRWRSTATRSGPARLETRRRQPKPGLGLGLLSRQPSLDRARLHDHPRLRQ